MLNQNQTVLPWIQTYTGKKFYFLNPIVDSVCIEDIAHALSNICRYTGHTKEFYSVAQHSVLAVDNVPYEDSLAALLHDATETYLTDISKPLKTLLPQYRELEDKVHKVISEKFGLPNKLPDSVKEADLRLLATEKRDLLIGEPGEWPIIKTVNPYPERIEPWSPKEAETLFLDLYTDIMDSYDTCFHGN